MKPQDPRRRGRGPMVLRRRAAAAALLATAASAEIHGADPALHPIPPSCANGQRIAWDATAAAWLCADAPAAWATTAADQPTANGQVLLRDLDGTIDWNTIGGASIADDSVNAAKIAADTITDTELADDVTDRLLPGGGSAGQVLSKRTSTAYDAEWTDDDAGLDQAAVDARVKAGVADFAETGNLDRVGENKLPAKLDDFLDALSDGGWTPEGAASADDPFVSSRLSTVAKPANPEASPFVYVQSFVVSPRYTNVHVVVRVPTALDVGELRLAVLGTDEPAVYHGGGSWTFVELDGAYNYYTQAVADLPLGVTVRIEGYQPFELDGERLGAGDLVAGALSAGVGVLRRTNASDAAAFGPVVSADLGAGSVVSSKIAAGAVGDAKIAGPIAASKLPASSATASGIVTAAQFGRIRDALTVADVGAAPATVNAALQATDAVVVDDASSSAIRRTTVAELDKRWAANRAGKTLAITLRGTYSRAATGADRTITDAEWKANGIIAIFNDSRWSGTTSSTPYLLALPDEAVSGGPEGILIKNNTTVDTWILVGTKARFATSRAVGTHHTVLVPRDDMGLLRVVASDHVTYYPPVPNLRTALGSLSEAEIAGLSPTPRLVTGQRFDAGVQSVLGRKPTTANAALQATDAVVVDDASSSAIRRTTVAELDKRWREVAVADGSRQVPASSTDNVPHIVPTATQSNRNTFLDIDGDLYVNVSGTLWEQIAFRDDVLGTADAAFPARVAIPQADLGQARFQIENYAAATRDDMALNFGSVQVHDVRVAGQRTRHFGTAVAVAPHPGGVIHATFYPGNYEDATLRNKIVFTVRPLWLNFHPTTLRLRLSTEAVGNETAVPLSEYTVTRNGRSVFLGYVTNALTAKYLPATTGGVNLLINATNASANTLYSTEDSSDVQYVAFSELTARRLAAAPANFIGRIRDNDANDWDSGDGVVNWGVTKDNLPDGWRFQFRIKIGSRTRKVYSEWVEVDEFESFPDVDWDRNLTGSGLRIARQIMDVYDPPASDSTPNASSFQLNFRGIDFAWVGWIDGRLAYRTQNPSYYTASGTAMEVWIKPF